MKSCYIGENELVIIENENIEKLNLPQDKDGSIVNHLGITDNMDLLEYLIVFGIIKEDTVIEYVKELEK